MPAAQQDVLPGLPRPVAPREPDDERLWLSFSRVDLYGRCPLRFKFAYLDKLPEEPSPHLSWGRSLHAAIEVWWTQKLPQPPTVEVLLQALYDHWDDSGFSGMERDEKLRWYRHAQDVLRRHHAGHAAAYTPAVASEAWFEIDLGDDLVVCGSIDQVARTPSGGLGIVDWKTNRNARTRQDVAASLQLAIYALAARELWGQEAEWVALDFVVPAVRVSVDRADIDIDGALHKIREVAAAIRAERFDPRPSRACDWCDFRAVCPAFEGDGPDVPGRALQELRRLRRRMAGDATRAAQLEAFVREHLGDEVVVEVDA